MELMNWLCWLYLDSVVVVFINIMLVYSMNEVDHVRYPKIVLQKLREMNLYTKLSKCEFWLESMVFLCHVLNQGRYYR